MIKILLADDDTSLRKVVTYKLKQKGYDITAVADGQQALNEIKSNQFDLLLTDMKMPHLNGIELLTEVKQLQPHLEVIMITAHGDISQAVEAIKLGAFDYLPKPFDDDRLFVTIEKALRVRKLEDENRSLKKQLADKTSSSFISGISKPFTEMMSMVEKIATADATIMLTGESGTGKEVIARIIHQQSDRSEQPFVAVNCAAIPDDLLESELFGHMKGAFTGAIKDKRGKFELAHNGTLFLDEIGELSTPLQAKLLRALQEKIIEPLGSEKSVEVDIRLIAATNQNLKKQVDNGSFREDLYYRLNVIPMEIPPLRKRPEDIPIFVHGFLKKYSPDKKITADDKLVERLKQCRFKGNIRELENLIERMVLLRKSDKLTLDDLPEEYSESEAEKRNQQIVDVIENNSLSFHEAEKKLIEDALAKTGGNKSKAAALLKIPRHILIYRLKKFEME